MEDRTRPSSPLNPLAQLPGDILLVRSKGLGGDLNTLAQRAVRFTTRCSYSHALLGFTPGVFIHSNKGRGVDLDYFEDLHLESAYREDWKVIRHRKVEQCGKLRDEIHRRARFHFEKSYNRLFAAKTPLRRIVRSSIDSSAFCSEFIARVYDDIGLPLTEKSPESVLPIDLEKLSSPAWIDVTLQYRKPWRPIEGMRGSCMLVIQGIRVLRAATKRNNTIVELLGLFNKLVEGWANNLRKLPLEELRTLRRKHQTTLEKQYQICYDVLVLGGPQDPEDLERLFFDQKTFADVHKLDKARVRTQCQELLDDEIAYIDYIHQYFSNLRLVSVLWCSGAELTEEVLGAYREATVNIKEFLADFEDYEDYTQVDRLLADYRQRLQQIPQENKEGRSVCEKIVRLLEHRRRFSSLRLRQCVAEHAPLDFDSGAVHQLLECWEHQPEAGTVDLGGLPLSGGG